jgi:hypothetical protein
MRATITEKARSVTDICNKTTRIFFGPNDRFCFIAVVLNDNRKFIGLIDTPVTADAITIYASWWTNPLDTEDIETILSDIDPELLIAGLYKLEQQIRKEQLCSYSNETK